MDFFASQELARRKTRQMIVLLILSVVATITGVYLVVFAVTSSERAGLNGGTFVWFDPILFGIVALAVCTVVGGGSLFKITQLRSGGSSVASMLGGRQLVPNTQDLNERKLLNVVEEMAIAAGTPVPPVFVLDRELGINAFAAGFTADDAIIGVNRGTLEQLNRDELQGVIAHEFSHVLNGDMRMSLRMIGLLHGIQLIALIGYFLVRSLSFTGSRSSSSSKDRGNGQAVLLLIGLGLIVVGSIGLFFARMIKASVSRQREYLADASAVQFTRNPDGIAGALKMIGASEFGSRVTAPNAELASHMYFGDMFGRRFSSLMSTHPPLIGRIQRIEPRFDGDFSEYVKLRERRLDRLEVEKRDTTAEPKTRAIPSLGRRGWMMPGLADRFPIDPAILIAGVGLPTEEDVVYSQLLMNAAPNSISHAVRDLFSARCVALAMLLDPSGEVRDRQLALIAEREGDPTQQETLRIEELVKTLSPALRLPMFEILQGTLAGMSQQQFLTFRGTVAKLSEADRQTSIFEFFLRHHLIVYLDRRFGTAEAPAIEYRTIQPLVTDINTILSLLVHSGHREPTEAQAAFQASTSAVFAELKPAFQLGALCGARQLSESLQRIARSTPAIKKQVLSAAAIAITHDRQVTVEEAELFRAIAESLDCPVPPVVATSPQVQTNTGDSRGSETSSSSQG